MLLTGHVHLWEHVDYGGAVPSQFTAGFSGTQEDAVPLPTALPPGIAPMPGVPVRAFQAWTHGFGFMTSNEQARRAGALPCEARMAACFAMPD